MHFSQFANVRLKSSADLNVHAGSGVSWRLVGPSPDFVLVRWLDVTLDLI